MKLRLYDNINKEYSNKMDLTECTHSIINKISEMDRLSISEDIKIFCFDMGAK
jgi:hypothetical protein